jgi:small conductance mechanosensitive channel
MIASAWTWITGPGVRIVLLLAAAWVAARILSAVAGRFFERLARHRDEEYAKRMLTLSSVTRITIVAALGTVAIFGALSEMGVAIGPMLTAAGVVGIAVGFGAQQLVQDVINGFFLLLDDQIRVGDVVKIGDRGGLVEKINLRITVLRDLEGNVHFIRNGQIGIVTNMTKEYSRYVFDVGVAYREDVDRVMEVMHEVHEELRADGHFGALILEPLEMLGLDRFEDSAVIVRARTKTKALSQWEVAREYNRRLKRRFDELSIEIPFPHRTVYMGQDREGQAPPVRVRMEREGGPVNPVMAEHGAPGANMAKKAKKAAGPAGPAPEDTLD